MIGGARCESLSIVRGVCRQQPIRERIPCELFEIRIDWR